MLTYLCINDYTLVDQLTLDFSEGLSVITGETGAGKSLIIDAIQLVLGERITREVVRQNSQQCSISLCFDLIKNSAARQWLLDQAFDDHECIIRRIIDSNGRSRITINGHPCPQNKVRELADFILRIHGQHQHQDLLKRDQQQEKLDIFAKNEELLGKIRAFYHEWQQLQVDLESLTGQSHDRDHQLELLRYQFSELNSLNLQADEWKALSEQHSQLHGTKQFLTQLHQALDLTIENDRSSAIYLLQRAVDAINEITLENPKLKNIRELLDTAAIHLQEAGSEIHQFIHHFDLSPEKLDSIEERLSTIYDLARKHHVNPEELYLVKEKLSAKIDALENAEQKIASIQKQQAELLKHYQIFAEKLTKQREKSSKILEKMMSEKMELLGMQGGQFKITLSPIETVISADGNEKIHFLVSTNPGQPFLPLQKVVSGGELSRISLALEVITAQKEGTPTLIFDEVDVGIGGKTAEIVGKLLRQLSESVQVLCITHLAQVAAQGHHHYKVTKITESTSTHSTIKPLTRTERIEEIARMLSGSQITEQTLTHAESILT